MGHMGTMAAKNQRRENAPCIHSDAPAKLWELLACVGFPGIYLPSLGEDENACVPVLARSV